MRNYIVSPFAQQTRDRINKLNHLISEAFLELGKLHKELSEDSGNEHIKETIRVVREINRDQINEAKALENSLHN